MRSGCLKAIVVMGGLGLACCGLSYWVFATPDPGVDMSDIRRLPGLADLPRLEDLPPDLATLVSPPGGLFGVPSAATATSDDLRGGPAGAAGSVAERPRAELAPFRVLVGTYPPQVAVLGLMAARDLMAERGYQLEFAVDVHQSGEVGPDAPCAALVAGDVHAAATTLESIALCPNGARIAVPVGQSVGNDMVLAPSETEGWEDAFAGPLRVVGDPAAAYLACFVSHAAFSEVPAIEWQEGVEPILPVPAEAGNSGVVAAREPYAARLQAARTDMRALVSSRELGVPWDVIAFSNARVESGPDAFDAFTQAYYRALRELARDPATAVAAFQAWSADQPEGSHIAFSEVFASPDALADALSGEAFASLGEASVIMAEPARLERRLSAAAAVWRACGLGTGADGESDWRDRVDARFVLAAREDPALDAGVADRPGTAAFVVADAPDASSLVDARGARARRALEAGVSIAFAPGGDEYADSEAAEETLGDAVRYLRTCGDCLVRIQPAALVTGTAACPDCPTPEYESPAIAQARRVYYDLRLRLGVPRTQLLLVDQPAAALAVGPGVGPSSALDGRVLLVGGPFSGP